MQLGKLLYFGDFFAGPLAVAALAALALWGRDLPSILAWLAAFAVGVVIWTLVEYVVHRWVYHRVAFFERFHDAHHDDPVGLIGAPSFLTIALILSLFLAPLPVVGVVIACGLAAGALAGYTAYVVVHHASHHFEPKPGSFLYRARLRHMAHHYQATPGNYGVSTSVWDRVFGTDLQKRIRPAR